MPIEPVTLTTGDGLHLEGELSVPDDRWAAVVLAHPHPQFGGNMRSIVTGTLFEAMPAAGVAAIRFNFRGVEGSGGSYDEGVGERLDVAAALAALVERVAGGTPVPLFLSGWSFGGDTVLAVADERVVGWAAVAPPLRFGDLSTMAAATDPRPKLLVLAQNDQFRDPESARAAVASWPATEVTVVGGADHFFVGRTDRVADAVLDWIRRCAVGTSAG